MEALPGELAGPLGRGAHFGCGIGLPSLVAAARGALVEATDWAPDAVALLQRNAARNGIALAARRVDWASPAELVARGPFDLVLAADVLYEARNVEWLVALLPRLGDIALVADPGREHARSFFGAMEGAFALSELEGGVHLLERR